MAQTLQLSEAAYREVQSYATEVGRDPEQMAEEVMLAGLHTLRRLHYFESKPKNVDVSDALEILSRAGRGNSPDPWDELPEDLKR